MNTLKLSDNLSFAVEPADKRLRLAVLNGATTHVCRLTTAKELHNFLALPAGQLFKGRLRLFKNDVDVVVNVKGEDVGVIGVEELMRNINF